MTLVHLVRTSRKAERSRCGRHSGSGPWAVGRIIFSLFILCSSALAAEGNETNTPQTRVEGTVFVQDAAGNQSFVAGASVKFSGPATFETESDENGRYVIAAVPSGTYSVEAIFPRFEGCAGSTCRRE